MAGAKPISKLPLRAVAAPFAVAGSQSAVATIALSVAQPGFPAPGNFSSVTVDQYLDAFERERLKRSSWC